MMRTTRMTRTIRTVRTRRRVVKLDALSRDSLNACSASKQVSIVERAARTKSTQCQYANPPQKKLEKPYAYMRSTSSTQKIPQYVLLRAMKDIGVPS